MLNKIKNLKNSEKTKRTTANLVIFLSFVVPIFLLFLVDPNSFNLTWKGRTFYLFFLWLLFMELILDWERFVQEELVSLKKSRIVAVGVTTSVPIAYVIGVNFFGLNQAVIELGKQIGTYWHQDWVLSLEYLVFTTFFAATILLAYKIEGLKQFSISLSLLGAIGTIYTIDTFYPYGAFTPFQAFVPFTASSAAQVLNWMGYKTSFLPYRLKGMPFLEVSGSSGSSVGFWIGWPCAGVQSLFIYTFVILLFFKKTSIPVMQKIVYFIIGAIGTYIVNILRIVSIYLIALNKGDWNLFHNFYGEFYSITWIVGYLGIIALSRTIQTRLFGPRFRASS